MGLPGRLEEARGVRVTGGQEFLACVPWEEPWGGHEEEEELSRGPHVKLRERVPAPRRGGPTADPPCPVRRLIFRVRSRATFPASQVSHVEGGLNGGKDRGAVKAGHARSPHGGPVRLQCYEVSDRMTETHLH